MLSLTLLSSEPTSWVSLVTSARDLLSLSIKDSRSTLSDLLSAAAGKRKACRVEALKSLSHKDGDIRLKLLSFPLDASLFGKDVGSRLEGWLQHQAPRTLGVAPLNPLGFKGGAKKRKSKKRKRGSFPVQGNQKRSWTNSQYRWKKSQYVPRNKSSQGTSAPLLALPASQVHSLPVPVNQAQLPQLPQVNNTVNPGVVLTQGQPQSQPWQFQNQGQGGGSNGPVKSSKPSRGSFRKRGKRS